MQAHLTPRRPMNTANCESNYTYIPQIPTSPNCGAAAAAGPVCRATGKPSSARCGNAACARPWRRAPAGSHHWSFCCRHVLDELRLDVRFWTCPKCKACHDRDINAARNLLMEGLRQLAARDERDLRVDAGDACPEEILVQVLAEEARSGQCNRACLEQVRLH